MAFFNMCCQCTEVGNSNEPQFPAPVPGFVKDALAGMNDEDERAQIRELINLPELPILPGENLSLHEISFANGSTYSGTMKDRKKNGRGRYQGHEGRIYEGQWLNDRCHGKGWLRDADSDYYGFWFKGSKDGLGFEVWGADGTQYVGQHKENNKEGYGVYIWKDGTKYVGQFKDDVIYGTGVFHDQEGKYSGGFEDSLQHGEGKYEYNDGTVYEGQFMRGERHGRGKISWKDGSTYDGEWSQGVQHGKGIEQVRNGARSEVEYSKSKRIAKKPIE